MSLRHSAYQHCMRCQSFNHTSLLNQQRLLVDAAGLQVLGPNHSLSSNAHGQMRLRIAVGHINANHVDAGHLSSEILTSATGTQADPANSTKDRITKTPQERTCLVGNNRFPGYSTTMQEHPHMASRHPAGR